eukprot:CAMPEP_0175378890 /NCGR_PEP_ID=MMETSP0095-20121207/25529_1 /TAXON_ID=311494 /ORGANISM="Alexandrium monilatum, Strain CCMP3105" /LENGTH=87 /DNA_ID=CAMNT_0016677229 /DNA_START=18 /DNA_END=282 /DNA_ORIENTATION=-
MPMSGTRRDAGEALVAEHRLCTRTSERHRVWELTRERAAHARAGGPHPCTAPALPFRERTPMIEDLLGSSCGALVAGIGCAAETTLQ